MLCMKPIIKAQNANVDKTENENNKQMSFHSLKKQSYRGPMTRVRARNRS